MLTQYLANGQGVVEVGGVISEVISQSQPLPPLMHHRVGHLQRIKEWLVTIPNDRSVRVAPW